MSLEPAAAALAGIMVLQEFLAPVQWLAMACVIVASVGATRSGTPRRSRRRTERRPVRPEFTEMSHDVDEPDSPAS